MRATIGRNASRLEISSVTSAAVSEGEKEAVTRIADQAAAGGCLGRVEVLGFVDECRSADWIVSTGVRVMNLLTKGSERHCRKQLRRTPEQHLEDIVRTVAYAREQELTVNVYLEDWSTGYRDSRDYVYSLVEGLQETGVAHIMLPDTLGVMMPDEVETSLSDMISRFP